MVVLKLCMFLQDLCFWCYRLRCGRSKGEQIYEKHGQHTILELRHILELEDALVIHHTMVFATSCCRVGM
jgi:hypothetical protein